MTEGGKTRREARKSGKKRKKRKTKKKIFRISSGSGAAPVKVFHDWFIG